MFPAPYPYLLLFLPAAVLARDDFRTRRVDASWLAVLSDGLRWGELAHARLADDVAANGRQCRAAPFIGNGSGRLPPPAAAVCAARIRCRRRSLPACRCTPVRTDGVSVVSDRRLRRRPPLVGLLRPSSSHDSLRRCSRHCAHRLGRPAIPPLMAVTPTHIPTEILRLLTAQEAAEYRLVPFAREADRIRCYGETGHDYTAAAEELEVLYGWQVEVVPIAVEELQRLLLAALPPRSADGKCRRGPHGRDRTGAAVPLRAGGRGAARQRQRHPSRTLRTALPHPYAHRRQARRALRRRTGAVHAAGEPDQDPRLARHLRKTAAAGRAHRLRPRRREVRRARLDAADDLRREGRAATA